jgi:hypothetical protein
MLRNSWVTAQLAASDEITQVVCSVDKYKDNYNQWLISPIHSVVKSQLTFLWDGIWSHIYVSFNTNVHINKWHSRAFSGDEKFSFRDQICNSVKWERTIITDEIVVYLNVLSWLASTQTEENHDKSHSGYSIALSSFEHGTSRAQLYNFTFTQTCSVI